MKNKNKSGILIAFSIFIYFLCYALIVNFNNYYGVSFDLLNGKLKISSLSGILVSLQMMISVTLAGINIRFARICAHLLPLFSIVSMAMYIIRSGDPEAIPGITMQTVCFIAVLIIYGQIKKREQDALTDYLTGTNNRRSIMKSLERMVKCRKPFSVMYIDIDEFKYINDNYGHKVGDNVIKITASRIHSVIGSKSILGRIGGDEYVVIVPDGSGETGILSENILKAVKKEIFIGDTDTRCFLTASIGIARYPDDTQNAAELMKYADIAMYNVKISGKNNIRYFENELEVQMNRISKIEALAKEYLTEGSFKFSYQPQYSTNTKELRGFETLLRIRDEDRKLVSVQELISVAEKSDIILRIDEYVLKNALNEFKPNILKHPDLTLSVNVSAKHISRKEFPDIIRCVLDETGFPPECLEIEITEYCLAGSVDVTVKNMNMLREMGIEIALDDFGTGYASLSYLSKLPVSLLKIDKSFIDELSDNNSVDFINAIISMGHILGCKVISEGIESQRQLDIVTEKNCDFIQGFLWGAPLDIKMATQLCDKVCR